MLLLASIIAPIGFHCLARSPRHVLERLAALVALVPLSGLLVLGSIWPSIFTLAAVAVLPATIALAGALVRPELVQRRWLHWYSLAALVVALASFSLEAWHLYHLEHAA